MRKFLLALLIITSTLGFTLMIQVDGKQVANAAIGSGFDPGRIIDDTVFTYKDSMSVQQIQAFLEVKNSVCLKNYVTPKALGNNQYGGNVSAAQAIWDAGQLYGINPQVLLVTLQKEQGLITTNNCTDYKYRSAMGFGCPDTAPCNAEWFGLSKQLYQGARHLRGFYANTLTYVPFRLGNYSIGFHPNSSCGSTVVNIQTRGTAALYSYTPYQPNVDALNNLYGSGSGCSSYGNRNFWRDFSDWFGSPVGDLVRTVNNATVYLVSEGNKFPINSLNIMTDYAALGPVRFVSDSYINSLTTGPVMGRMVGSNNGTLYFVNAGIKLPFGSCNLVADYGYSCASVNYLTDGQLSKLVNGPHASSFLKSAAGATIYYMENGKKRPIPSMRDLLGLNIPLSINSLSDYVIQTYPEDDLLFAGGSLVKTADSSSIYVVNDWSGTKSLNPITTFSIPQELGLNLNFRTISNQALGKYTILPNLTTKLKCGSTYYIGTNGVTREMPEARFADYGLDQNSFITSGQICKNLPKVSPAFGKFIQITNGTIYYVDGGIKKAFTGFGVFLNYGGNGLNTVSVSNTFADSIPSGANLSS